MKARRVAVVGGGWAGLAAAVEAVRAGHAVTLFEMAVHPGGRARAIHDAPGADTLDNGQHILIGAYSATLALMRAVGIDPEAVLLRTPLRLTHADGSGLQLPAGAPLLAFVRGVWANPRWRRGERLALLAAAARWRLAGFRCDPMTTVADLTAGLPRVVCDELIDPLCVAALNTSSAEASADVFLRVLRDALLAGPGSADLLLPRVDLSSALPVPAARWLAGRGATVRLGHRVRRIESQGHGWQVDGEAFDRVVLAATAGEAARLTEALAPDWSAAAAALRHDPIVTLYLRSAGARLPAPMLALHADDASPAQYVFDRGQLGGSAGLLAFVVSGARTWVGRGREATLAATLRQSSVQLGALLRGPLEPIRIVTEKRATFRCTPALQRPRRDVAAGLTAAGDYVDGPYPATLEGAVRSGIAAVRDIG